MNTAFKSQNHANNGDETPTNPETPFILTFKQACAYMSMSKWTLYKLTAGRKLKFSKPTNKCIYFSRTALDEFLLSNPIKTVNQVEDEAATYVTARTHKHY